MDTRAVLVLLQQHVRRGHCWGCPSRPCGLWIRGRASRLSEIEYEDLERDRNFGRYIQTWSVRFDGSMEGEVFPSPDYLGRIMLIYNGPV